MQCRWMFKQRENRNALSPVSPVLLRPKKVQSDGQTDWSHRECFQEGDGRPDYPMKSKRPSETAAGGCVVLRRFVEVLDATSSGV